MKLQLTWVEYSPRTDVMIRFYLWSDGSLTTKTYSFTRAA